VQGEWVEEIKKLVYSDPFYGELRRKLQEGKLDSVRYQAVEGLFFYKKRILIVASAGDL